MNPENLVPNGKRSANEVRENSAKGGRRSGEVRRAKRDCRKMIGDMLSGKVTLDAKTIETMKKLGFMGKGKAKDVYTAEDIINAAIIQKAMKGDIRASELLHKIMGDYSDAVNVNVNTGTVESMQEVEQFLYDGERDQE